MRPGYEAIISLGGACAPAFNIRRIFGNDRAFPFDWWISSRQGIEKIIRDDFAGPYRVENMRLSPDRQSVRDISLNIHYVHDFPRGPDKHVLPDFAPHVPERLQRYQVLAERMRRICSTSRVLFVRLEPPGRPKNWDGSHAAAHARAEKWLALFREKWPNGQADILTLNTDPNTPPAPPLKLPSGMALFDNIETVTGDGGWQNMGYARMFRRQEIVSLAEKTGTKRLNFKADDALASGHGIEAA
jgi:hypothetical protein